MRKFDFLMLNVGYAEHDGDWNFRNINSPFTRLYYVTDGEATILINSRQFTLTPGNMYIIPAFTEHSDFCEGKFNHYYIHIYEDVPVGEGIIEQYEFPLEIKGLPIDRMLFETLCNHNSSMALRYADPRIYDNKHSLIECVRLNRNRPLFDRLESMGIILQLIGRFIKYAKPKYQTSDRRIEHAIKSADLKSGELVKVDTLAKEAGMTPDHFIRLFKSELGRTPAQFLIDRKMMKAKLMLASEALSIKEVAYSLGYDDVSYFTRLFKRHTNFTPRQYRDSFNT